jgi:hypothetical protein
MADITHKRGDTFTMAITATDSTGAAIDLTDFTLASQVRKADEVRTLVENLTATVTDATAGAFTLSATATQTALWPIETLLHDVQFTQPDGAVWSSPTDRIRIVEDITR